MPPNSPQPPKQRTRGLSRFKRSEASRLVKGARDAGLTVCGIEVDRVTGNLRVLVGQPGEPNNDLDSWLKRKDAPQA
jgi:hypothetical protein